MVRLKKAMEIGKPERLKINLKLKNLYILPVCIKFFTSET
jgi:hypothetical protein